MPGARVKVLPGVGHTSMYEATQTTCALLMAFAAAAIEVGGTDDRDVL